VRRSGRAHYVGHNATTRVPRNFIYLDTEAWRDRNGVNETQTFRCAVAAYDAMRRDRRGWQDRQWCIADRPEMLWGWIASKCRRKARTVLVAHNLAYDLRIGDAFTHLPKIGWRFKAGRVDDKGAWFIFANEDRTLVCVDSLAWLPVGLDTLGDAVGIPKLPLPADEDPADVWVERCKRDVEILAECWSRLMAWVEREDLGNWKISGAGQAWAAFRHRFMTHELLVHESDDARDAERHAAHTGRCEAWRHGRLRGGPWTEYDFHCSYATIAAECEIPIYLAGEMWRPSLNHVAVTAQRCAVLAEVEVWTDTPVVPFRSPDGILWPVGHFRSTLWENELHAAIARGAELRIERAWRYNRAPALAKFARWIIDGVDGTRKGVDPIERIALKHWSRATIGRTAATWPRSTVWGKHSRSSVGIRECYDATSGERFSLLQLGHQLVRVDERRDNPDSMVAVMSWIMAEARVRLWAAMEVAGLENVAYVDTDSLIVNPEGAERLSAARIAGLRVKGKWRSLQVLGPRQLVPGAKLRAAGVPTKAVRIEPDVWEADVWAGLSRSIRSGTPAQVDVTTRRFRVEGVDRRREHLSHGATAPFTVQLDADAVGA
jgi:hypothetical protein